MSAPEPIRSDTADVVRHVRQYLLVWGILLLGMLGAVVVNQAQLDHRVALTVAISTASALVVGFVLMHLSVERKKTVFAVLLVTLFFFSFMMYLVVWSHDQRPPGTVYFGTPSQPGAATAKEGK
jgi:cytochrome c oxidase subunit IV